MDISANDNINDNNLIQSQIKKEITNLFKLHLEILSQLRVDNNIMIKKIEKYTNEDFMDNINYFTDEKYDSLRKLILDVSNDSIRNIINFLEYFDCQLNREKINKEIKNQEIKKPYKKIIINSPIEIK